MKNNYLTISKITILLFVLAFIPNNIHAQTKTASEFWKNVQFGGGLQLYTVNGFTNVGVSPSMLYNVNDYVSVGTGLQISYVDVTNNYSSLLYGASVTTLLNPIETIQLSVDLDQLRVSTTFDNPAFAKQSFWNTALWLGAGYRNNNITVGVKYNVLFDVNKSVYSNAFLPFVRVYF